MIIGVDVDGVVADLHSEWLRLYNADWNDNLRSEDIVTWDTHLYVKPECGKAVYRYLNSPQLYDNVQPIVGALAGIETLRDAGHRIVYVTSNVKGMTDPKWMWLERYRFLTNQGLPSGSSTAADLVVAHDKSLLRADILIDDGVHNVKAFKGWSMLFDAPWNRDDRVAHRVRGWAEVLEAIL